jgi:hypothetical protein
MSAKTTAERQKAWRAKRQAEGHRLVTVWLDPDVAAAVNLGSLSHAELQRLVNDAVRKALIRT